MSHATSGHTYTKKPLFVVLNFYLLNLASLARRWVFKALGDDGDTKKMPLAMSISPPWPWCLGKGFGELRGRETVRRTEQRSMERVRP